MVKRVIKTFSFWSSWQSQSVGNAALLIALAGIVSRFLGFLRDRILASQFGAGDVLDAYYAAFRIPDFIYGLLVLGAFGAAFTPVFTELLVKNKKEEAWKLASELLQSLLFSVGILSLLGIVFAPWLIRLITPGFGADKQATVVMLTRLMFISPILLVASAVFGGMLMSFKQFVAYSLAPILYNVGIISGVLFFFPFMGERGLAWGVVFGSFLHMLIQYPSLRRLGFHFRFRSGFYVWKDEVVRRVVKLMIPRSLATGVSQVSLLVVTIFASTLSSGSLSVFTLANNIESVPLGLFGVAFATAVFPSFSLLAAEKKEKDFFAVLAETARRVLFFILPVSVFMIIFRAQFVRVILGTGHFDWEDTILTFEVLKFLAISLFAQSLIPLFSRAFFALQNTKTPLYISLVSEAVNILLIFILLPRYSISALAIAFSVSNILNLALLYFSFRKKISFWDDGKFLTPIMNIFFAALLAGAIAQISKSIFALTTNELDTFAEVFLQLVTGLAIGGASFVLFCHWFQIDELKMVKRFLLCKVLRQPETAAIAEDHPERGEW